MPKWIAYWKASYLELRLYIYIIMALIAAGVLANFIINLAMGPELDNREVTFANLCLCMLVFVASVLPLRFFTRIIHLGASRSQYYTLLITIYAVWAAAMALLNTIWQQVQPTLVSSSLHTYNLVDIFGWSQFGIIGSFVYQFGIYMLFLSVWSLLFSGMYRLIGWILWFVLIIGITLGTSLPAYRPLLAKGFSVLLFNDSLIQGFGIALLLTLVFLAGGWGLTRKRPVL
ncbi:hypothetical protein [Paenibacillus sp. Z6-24]